MLFVRATQGLLVPCGLETGIGFAPFLPWVVREVPVLDYPPVFPSASFALSNLIVSVVIVLVLPLLRFLPRPLVIYLVFLSAINGAFGVAEDCESCHDM